MFVLSCPDPVRELTVRLMRLGLNSSCELAGIAHRRIGKVTPLR